MGHSSRMSGSLYSRMTRGSQFLIKEWEWPTMLLLFWRFIMYATAGTLLGIFAYFIQVQQQMNLGSPWLFAYGVTVGTITVVYLIIGEAALLKKRLIPRQVMLHTFILFALYLTGFIETAIILFGSPSNINGACNAYVNGDTASGVTIDTLAWLEQHSICQSWDAVFAFWIVGAVFLIWLFVLAISVDRLKRTHTDNAC